MENEDYCKLQHLEPLKPLDVQKIVPPSKDLTTPINVFGDTPKPKSKNPKLLYSNLNGRINPLHYKTRDMCKDYNSLMNKLYPNSSVSTVELPTVETVKANEAVVCDTDVSEDPKQMQQTTALGLLPGPGVLETFCKTVEMKDVIESSILDSLEPTAKDYELDESLIETVPYSKKKCVVWWEGDTIPYGKFRENCDNIIFFVGEDAYGYSKQCLYEEYRKSQELSKTRVYFNLDLNWEDGEILWIPMSQILRILEFSHPVYELQKTKFSTKVWNAVPIKLQK